MVRDVLDGQLFTQMMSMGAKYLSEAAQQVDALNVFPVPDGDTGTNMNLTLTSGVEEMHRKGSQHIGEVASALSRGLLMGARGNSGVILSQLFRGFAQEIKDKEMITVDDFARALQQGVDTAYKAVIKPVEGTILTVAREAAKHTRPPDTSMSLIELMDDIVQAAKQTLQKTPDMLPVLKETGVVDAGGQGLVYIYEGFLAGLKGETVPEIEEQLVSMDSLTELAHKQSAQSHMTTEEIEFGYCTEFIVQLLPDKIMDNPFDEDSFRNTLNERGDSLLVVADDDLVKVHIHTEEPLDVIGLGTMYGEIRTAKVENMREQHRAIIEKDSQSRGETQETKRYGIVAIAMGEGIANIFRSLGADEVIEGGQTMNPSTEDIVQSLRNIRADDYIILPNNSNIVMAAEQAGKVMERPVTVIPSKTVPQGLSAMLAFNPTAKIEENTERMVETVNHVKTGQVTYAVRDSHVDGCHIKKGDYLGIADGKISASHPSLTETARDLLQEMIVDDTEIVTIYYGQDTSEGQVEEVQKFLERRFPDVEVEVHSGGQPLYYYLFSAE